MWDLHTIVDMNKKDKFCSECGTKLIPKNTDLPNKNNTAKVDRFCPNQVRRKRREIQ